jgi:hypothetical protein
MTLTKCQVGNVSYLNSASQISAHPIAAVSPNSDQGTETVHQGFRRSPKKVALGWKSSLAWWKCNVSRARLQRPGEQGGLGITDLHVLAAPSGFIGCGFTRNTLLSHGMEWDCM